MGYGQKKPRAWGQIGMAWLLIFALGLLIYSNTWHSPFVFDDIHTIVDNGDRQNLNLNWRNWLGKRALPNISFDLNYHWNEYRLPGYHAVNIAIHLATALTVFVVAYLLAGLTLKDGSVKVGRRWLDFRVVVGLISSLFFLAHPIQTQAVTYIVQRLASMATFFYAQSIMWFLLWRTGRAGWKYVWAALSIAAGIGAMHSKEISFSLPVVLTLMEFAIWPVTDDSSQPKELLARTVKLIPWLLLLLIIPMYLMDVPGYFINSQPPNAVADASLLGGRLSLEKVQDVTAETHQVERLVYLRTQFSVVAKYIRLIILPVGLNIDHDHPWSMSWTEWRTVASIGLLLALAGGAGWLLWRGYTMVGLGALMFFIMLLPESSIIPITDVIFEHRLYLPMVGVSLAAGAGSYHFYRWLAEKEKGRRWRAGWLAVVAVYIFLLAGGTWLRNGVWADELTLWRDATSKSPNKPRPKNNLGKALLERRMFNEAKDQYLQEIALDPQSVSGHNNLGSIYGLQGDYEQALAEVNKALAINPSHDSSYNNLGNIYMLQGKSEEAEKAYERSVEINPKDAGVWSNLGDIRIKKQEYDEAIAAFEKAISLHDEKALWHSKLGGLLGQEKKYAEAEEELKLALQMDPSLVNAYVNLGNVFLEQQRWAEALGAYQAALKLKPGDAEVVTSLGQALLATGDKESARQAWQAVLKVEPENQKVKELLASI